MLDLTLDEIQLTLERNTKSDYKTQKCISSAFISFDRNYEIRRVHFADPVKPGFWIAIIPVNFALSHLLSN